jgi:4-hydroxy-3-methylbut-2-enyl diphosphate reductase IspH
VTKVHVEVAKLAKEGYEFIMIGHKGHPEVEGTMGQLDRAASTWWKTWPMWPRCSPRRPPSWPW